jgi:hypothetical protein
MIKKSYQGISCMKKQEIILQIAHLNQISARQILLLPGKKLFLCLLDKTENIRCFCMQTEY